jgi:hypothetical protein
MRRKLHELMASTQHFTLVGSNSWRENCSAKLHEIGRMSSKPQMWFPPEKIKLKKEE